MAVEGGFSGWSAPRMLGLGCNELCGLWPALGQALASSDQPEPESLLERSLDRWLSSLCRNCSACSIRMSLRILLSVWYIACSPLSSFEVVMSPFTPAGARHHRKTTRTPWRRIGVWHPCELCLALSSGVVVLPYPCLYVNPTRPLALCTRSTCVAATLECQLSRDGDLGTLVASA